MDLFSLCLRLRSGRRLLFFAPPPLLDAQQLHAVTRAGVPYLMGWFGSIATGSFTKPNGELRVSRMHPQRPHLFGRNYLLAKTYAGWYRYVLMQREFHAEVKKINEKNNDSMIKEKQGLSFKKKKDGTRRRSVFGAAGAAEAALVNYKIMMKRKPAADAQADSAATAPVRARRMSTLDRMKAIIGVPATDLGQSGSEANTATDKDESEPEATKADASLALQATSSVVVEAPSASTTESPGEGADSRPGNRPAFGAPHLAVEKAEANSTEMVLETPKRVAQDIARSISGLFSGPRGPVEDLGPVTDEIATPEQQPAQEAGPKEPATSQPLPSADDSELLRKRADLMEQLQEIDAKLKERGVALPSDVLAA